MPNYNSKSFQAPEQVNTEKGTSESFKTDKVGVVYPDEISRDASAYIEGEGSMGFERNQGVKRDAWKVGKAELERYGQHKMDRMGKNQGSYGI